MKHMIMIRTRAQKFGAALFLAGVAAIGGIGAGMAQGDSAQGAQSADSWADGCLDYATTHGMSVDVCLPFLVPEYEPTATDTRLVTQADVAAGFTYDAGKFGTMVELPDGTRLFVPTDREACPLLTLADTSTEWCINWSDLTPGEDTAAGS